MSDIADVDFDAILRKHAGEGATEARTIRHSHVGRKGDLTVELHHGTGDAFGTGIKNESALYLYRRGHEKDGVFVPLSSLWMWNEYGGQSALRLLAPPLAGKLYGFISRIYETRVVDVVQEFADELRKAPPDPRLTAPGQFEQFLEGCARQGLEFRTELNGHRTTF